MAEKTLNTRVVLKHDSDTNWAITGIAGKGANFVPKSGEVIVYEYSDGSRKFKIGNGKSTAAALPFQNAVGPTGPKGDKGATGAIGPTGPQGERGNTGAAGTRGSRWSTGTAITGTSTTATTFSGTGITDALVNDMYLNTSTGHTYRCTVAGAANAAKWVYAGSIKGATGSKGDKGDTGEKGSTGAVGPVGPTGASGVGVITNLNGSTATGKTAYAPTTAGTSGYYLKSNGSGAPTWAALSIDDGDIG